MGVHTLIGRNQIPLAEQRQRGLQDKQSPTELAAERAEIRKNGRQETWEKRFVLMIKKH